MDELSPVRLLQLLNRCLRIDQQGLEKMLSAPGFIALKTYRSAEGDGFVYLSSSRSGMTVCLVRDSDAPMALLDLLLNDLSDVLASRPIQPITITLDGHDLDAAKRLTAQGYRQQDCDHLLSFIGQPVAANLVIRPYHPEELDAYIRLFDSAFTPLHQANGAKPYALWSSRPDWAREWFASAAARGEIFSVWVEGQMAACCRLDADTIDSVAVSPKMQGRGLGRAVINHCIAEIQSRGHQRVYLYVADSNTRAHRLYEQIGFVAEMVSRTMTKDWIGV